MTFFARWEHLHDIALEKLQAARRTVARGCQNYDRSGSQGVCDLSGLPQRVTKYHQRCSHLLEVGCPQIPGKLLGLVLDYDMCGYTGCFKAGHQGRPPEVGQTVLKGMTPGSVVRKKTETGQHARLDLTEADNSTRARGPQREFFRQ